MAKKAFVYDGSQWVDIAQSTVDLSGYPALATNQFGFRNKIINGDFRINQRNYIKNTNLASGAYGFDRWKSTFTNTSLDFVSAPNGQMVTISSGGSIEQIIERENMPAGTYVLSWTGTATGRVYNTGTTPPSYAASPVLVTLDGTANVEVEFTASGGTRTLQNVQLEPGNVASAFERRPVGTELALCQRYYEQITSYNTGVIYSGTVNYLIVSGYFATTKRVAPTMGNITTSTVRFLTSAGSSTDTSSIITNSATPYAFYVIPTITGYSANGYGVFFFLTNITASAEL